MAKPLRLLVALLTAVSLVALAACGDDDDAATDTTGADTRDPAGEDGGEDGGDDEGAPDENPCAEGASGELGEGGAAPADDATPVEVTATEYAFAGGDELAAPGEYALTLVNAGQELHEAVILRLADDEVRPVAEILASGDEPETTDVGFAFACPGATADPVAVSIEEPGRYVVLCFVPVGALPTSTPEELEGLAGPPHAAQGMVKELTVS